MKTTLLLLVIGIVFGQIALADEATIEIKVTSMTNAARGELFEVCGTARHSNGIRPLLVTVKHSASFYTTVTNGDGQWCTVIKRWTFNGNIDVSAATLNGAFSHSPVFSSSLNEDFDRKE